MTGTRRSDNAPVRGVERDRPVAVSREELRAAEIGLRTGAGYEKGVRALALGRDRAAAERQHPARIRLRADRVRSLRRNSDPVWSGDAGCDRSPAGDRPFAARIETVSAISFGRDRTRRIRRRDHAAVARVEPIGLIERGVHRRDGTEVDLRRGAVRADLVAPNTVCANVVCVGGNCRGYAQRA